MLAIFDLISTFLQKGSILHHFMVKMGHVLMVKVTGQEA